MSFDVTDPLGASESVVFAVTVTEDTTPPAITDIDLQTGSDTAGASTSDEITFAD